MEDKLKRGFLFFAAALFAVPTYLLWRNALVEGWPQDLNGWMGLILFPTMSIVALIYAIFYRRAKQVDDEWQRDLENNTRRGKRLFIVLYSFMIMVLPGIGAVDAHLINHEPIQEWEYVAFALIIVIWIVGLIINATDGVDDRLHNFLTRKGWFSIDRLIFKDQYEDETEE